jgi:hypothetical protein
MDRKAARVLKIVVVVVWSGVAIHNARVGRSSSARY